LASSSERLTLRMHSVPYDQRPAAPELGEIVRAEPRSLPLKLCAASQAPQLHVETLHRHFFLTALLLAAMRSQCNIQPQTREERKAALFREDLEKLRLRQRRENYCVYEEGGLVPLGPDSLSYITEADRFVTDAAAVNKAERDASVNHKEQINYNKRMVRAENEERRWRTIETQHQLEQRRLEEMRENHSFARSNKTSMPYNPINLRYDDGNDGDRLRYSDESLRYRGALRAEHLQRRQTSTGYDPITGTPIDRVHVPSAPARPGQY